MLTLKPVGTIPPAVVLTLTLMFLRLVKNFEMAAQAERRPLSIAERSPQRSKAIATRPRNGLEISAPIVAQLDRTQPRTACSAPQSAERTPNASVASATSGRNGPEMSVATSRQFVLRYC